jgi:transposase-like protein
MSKDPNIRYCGHRFPAELIAHMVWFYFRFPRSLRMVEDLLAVRGIAVSHQTIRRRAEKFGRRFAATTRRFAVTALRCANLTMPIGLSVSFLWRPFVVRHGWS